MSYDTERERESKEPTGRYPIITLGPRRPVLMLAATVPFYCLASSWQNPKQELLQHILSGVADDHPRGRSADGPGNFLSLFHVVPPTAIVIIGVIRTAVLAFKRRQ
ncbi:hypothetical protein M441DRAFT_35624 [Trichoderma asperellum CBS 433.97]|uniref:Uncharacterized protein n=1 Tax=Trichoderma asperellum (strain ATCC 204424 / CBS 433.97 / NBRC 101777) TaxID=1042311 RepID=A0A2T3ZEN3_TRIA4|nr:hypothetical protein M441DRAFT_35624 [Trichoderma asperellum CBS 433.97]PTB43268.1 hypothetical protein M441DRAFT_35624 [Trichoderma asperellum CBS 433.97]